MTIDKLKRVLWRLQEMEKSGLYTANQIRRAIMEECGTDERTLSVNLKRLTELKLLIPARFGMMKIGIETV